MVKRSAQTYNITLYCNTVTYKSITSVHNSITSACNIILFQAMSVFCRRIKGMLRFKVTDDGYLCRPTGEHLQINPYRFLRIICTYTDSENNPYTYWFLIIIPICTNFWEKSIYWEKFVCIRVQIFGPEKLKNDEIFMEWYNVTDWCYALQLHYAVIFCTLQPCCEELLLHNGVTLRRCITVLHYVSVPT